MKKPDHLVQINWLLFYSIIVGLAFVTVTACDQTPPTPPKHVTYHVLDKAFIPGQHGSSVGMSMKGHLVFSNVTTQDTFKLLLQGDVGAEPFTDQVDAVHYAQVKVGDCVDYTEGRWSREFYRDLGPCP